MTTLRRLFSAVVLPLVGFGLVGCGGSEPEVTASLLRGKVTVGDKPVTTGTVTAYKGSTKVMEAPINPDGTYEFANPTSGEYQLTVTKTDTPTPYGRPVKVPAKNSDPAQSGLSAKVESGQTNNQDLVLSAK